MICRWKDIYLYDPPRTEVMVSPYDMMWQMVGAIIMVDEVFWAFEVAFNHHHRYIDAAFYYYLD